MMFTRFEWLWRLAVRIWLSLGMKSGVNLPRLTCQKETTCNRSLNMLRGRRGTYYYHCPQACCPGHHIAVRWRIVHVDYTTLTLLWKRGVLQRKLVSFILIRCT